MVGGGELRRTASLVLYKASAYLRAESERTYAGFVWWILEPALSMLVYYLVFSFLLDRGGPEYVAFLLVGIVTWRWFQSTILRGANAIVSAKTLMQQVYVPKLVFPLATLLSDTFKFGIVFLLLLVGLALTGFPVATGALVALPLVLGVELLLVTALTVLAAGAVPFLPDLRIVLQNLLRLWFFLSGVFYDLEIFPERAQFWLRLNPMAVILESYRGVLLEGEWPDVPRLLAIAAGATVLVALVVWGVTRSDYVYPKLRL